MRFVLAFALVGASLSVQPAAAADGRSLYMDNCAACHRPTGAGVPGAFPALVGSKLIQGDPKEPITRVLQGRGGMPSFHDELSDQQIAVILSYVRQSWGNKGKPVNPTQVSAQRGGKRQNTKAVLQAH
ncbi:cytochrome c [Phenylobacterium sp.]|uniref:c-type cytochrome n=1 Tax=Phenylobacterium sp. TaxID=1871053 RepID=UPI00286A12D5|nr:cytochrome c [Phenylobacterium sp.]